jgi:hypothetical protein
MIGIGFLIAVGFLDFSICGRSITCPLDAFTNRIGHAYDAFIQQIGRALGARYGYVPYFPNRATQVFLNTLALTLPWLCFFVLGIFAYLVVRLVRDRRDSQYKPLEKS